MGMKELNLPNLLTVLRVFSVPFFVYFLLGESQLFRLIAFFLFLVASVTDLIDGYLARRWKQVTELGKFLDPLADKALVLGAFITFIFLSDQIQLWMVLCIIGRDMLITVLRYLAIKRGRSLITSRLGKVKTFFQMFSIVVILLGLLLVSYRETSGINEEFRMAARQGESGLVTATRNLQLFAEGRAPNVARGLASFLPFYLMLITTIITLISGLRYLFTNYRLLWPPPFDLFRAQREE